VVDHLRPALAEVRSAVRRHRPLLDGIDLEHPEALLGDAKRARAYQELDGHAGRHDALRSAWRHLHRWLGEPTMEDGTFAMIGNIDSIYGDRWPQRRFLPPILPEGRLSAFYALMTSEDIETWLPLPQERDDAYRRVRDRFAPRSRESAFGAYGG